MAYFQKSKAYFLKSKAYFFESKPDFEKQAFLRLWLFIFGTVFPAGGLIKGTGIWKKKQTGWSGMEYFKREKNILWYIPAAFKIYMVRHARPRKVKEQVKDDHSPLK